MQSTNILPAALEQAYKIAKDIGDPGLKTQQFGRIAECFVKIGCILLKEPKSRTDAEVFSSEIYPFERGLSIIKENCQKTANIAEDCRND